MFMRPGNVALLLAFVLAVDAAQATPLHDAAQAGALVQASELIMDDPSAVNVRDKRGFTPLSMASQQGHLAVVKLLVEKGAAVDAKANYPGAPAAVAAFYADPAIVKRLVIKAPIEALGATPLFIAAKQGHAPVVSVLLEHGAAIDALADAAGSPLSAAARSGHANVVKLLLERGAKIDCAGTDGSTPLHDAAEDGQLETARLLLERGAAIEGARADRITPLATAAQHGHVDLVRLLVEKGANVNAESTDGLTPLQRVSQAGTLDADTRRQMITLLRARGATP